MPCVSLKHRRIYQNTVARRIKLRKLYRRETKALRARLSELVFAPVKIASNQSEHFHEGINVQIHPHRRAVVTKASLAAQSEVNPQTQNSDVSIVPHSLAKVLTVPATRRPKRHFWHHPTHAELLNAESQFGRTLFGPIPAGHQREFFHDRDNVWIWHEGWSAQGMDYRLTVRYEVRPNGVFKKIAAGKYVRLLDDELENFRRAAHAYLYLIKHNLYRLA